MNITPKEILVLRAIAASEYQNDETPVDCPVWADCLYPGTVGGILESVSAAQLPGVVSSLNKKGLVRSQRDDNLIEMTQAGWEVLTAHDEH